jgi:hypothetical protein
MQIIRSFDVTGSAGMLLSTVLETWNGVVDCYVNAGINSNTPHPLER